MEKNDGIKYYELPSPEVRDEVGNEVNAAIDGAWECATSVMLPEDFWKDKPAVKTVMVLARKLDEFESDLEQSIDLPSSVNPADAQAVLKRSLPEFMDLMRQNECSAWQDMQAAFEAIKEAAQKCCVLTDGFSKLMLSTFFVGGIYKKTYGKTAPAEVASALRLEQLNQQTPKSLQQGIASSGDGDSKTLRNAFNGEFFEHYSLLSPLSARIKWCADNWDRANYYAPYTCLVQSSGSGKSRTVVELGRQKCWLFYVCFRKPGMSGYPPRSFIADNLSEPLHFRLTASKSTLINRKEVIDYCTIRCIEVIYYVCFWTACIRQLRDDLLMSVGVSLEQHRRDWINRQLMHDDTAVDGLRIGCAFWQPILSRTRCIFDATITGIEIAPGTTDAFPKLCRFANYQLAISWKSLNEVITAHPSAGSYVFTPLVLLGMDEARELIDAEGSLFEQVRYSMQFWPLKTARDLKSFCVLIDTQSRLNNYQPNPIKNPSLRHVISSNLYEPIQIYGNWNISVPGEWWLNLDGSDKQALSVQFQQSTFKSGRPLWYSYYKNLEPSVNRANLRNLAAVKLLGISSYDQIPKMTEKEITIACMALLGSRLALNFHSSMEYMSEMCGSNLAACYHIFPSGKRMLGGYPSEPIVAEAAAYVTRFYPKFNFSNQLSELTKEIRKNSIEAGYRGELVAKCMLLRAKDCTVPPNETFFTSVCTVKEFLRSLGNTSNINGVLDLLAEKRPQHTQFIESGLLSFTHFIYVVFTPTRDEMKQYFARGAAIFCKRNQKGADIILPVLLPPTTPVTKSSPYSFSYILISVKNYSSQSNEAKLAPSRTRAETVGIDIPENINYSHMTLFMDVGADLPPQLFSPTVGRQSERLDELARYKYPATISFQGISPEVYQFLRPPNNEPGGQPSTEIAQISSERQTNHSDLHDKLLQMSRVLVDPIDQVSAEDQNVYKSLMILTYSAQHDCFGGR